MKNGDARFQSVNAEILIVLCFSAHFLMYILHNAPRPIYALSVLFGLTQMQYPQMTTLPICLLYMIHMTALRKSAFPSDA